MLRLIDTLTWDNTKLDTKYLVEVSSQEKDSTCTKRGWAVYSVTSTVFICKCCMYQYVWMNLVEEVEVEGKKQTGMF